MIRETISVMRDFSRIRTIAGILMKYGWGDVAKRLGKGSLIGRAGNAVNSSATPEILAQPSEVRARMAMEELGPTFVKLGQVLATRPDIFPPSWIEEFAKLQDHVPPVAFAELLPGLEAALGKSPFEVFRDLQTEPVAAAPISKRRSRPICVYFRTWGD
jgi:ubiquinone biosynthesis protein